MLPFLKTAVAARQVFSTSEIRKKLRIESIETIDPRSLTLVKVISDTKKPRLFAFPPNVSDEEIEEFGYDSFDEHEVIEAVEIFRCPEDLKIQMVLARSGENGEKRAFFAVATSTEVYFYLHMLEENRT